MGRCSPLATDGEEPECSSAPGHEGADQALLDMIAYEDVPARFEAVVNASGETVVLQTGCVARQPWNRRQLSQTAERFRLAAKHVFLSTIHSRRGRELRWRRRDDEA